MNYKDFIFIEHPKLLISNDNDYTVISLMKNKKYKNRDIYILNDIGSDKGASNASLEGNERRLSKNNNQIPK